MMIGLPISFSKLTALVSSLRVNTVLLPLNSFEKSSSICNLPNTQPANSSSFVNLTLNEVSKNAAPANLYSYLSFTGGNPTFILTVVVPIPVITVLIPETGSVSLGLC